MSNAAKYETTVTLPTNGHLYGPDGPVDVTLRAMTTKEEKILLGSSSDNVFDKVIKACIVEPKDLNLDDLILSDINFLLLKLRIHTYGSDYKIETTCPNCGSIDYRTINLDDFPIYTLSEDFKEPIKMKLPMSGDTLECNLLRNKDVKFVDRLAKKLSRTSKTNTDAIAYNIRMAKYIQSINGEKVDGSKAQAYTQNMHSRDSAYFWWKINKILIGYDTTMELTCSECNSDYETAMPITSEFFRPTFD